MLGFVGIIASMDKSYISKPVEPLENIEGIYSFVSDGASNIAQDICNIVADGSLDKGQILMVLGPEKSGKSMVGINLKKLFDKAMVKNRSLVFSQPKVDRPDVPFNKIVSRIGEETEAISFESKIEIEKIFHEHQVVVMDEVQFVPADLQSYLLYEITLFVERGGIFIGIGLDHTSQGGEFIFAALLKSRANKVFKLFALCQMCGRKADKYSQRLINGIPATIDTPLLLSPSEKVSYEPRCDECFIVKKIK